MLLQKLKDEAVSVEVVVDRIKSNHSGNYLWYAARNKKNCLIEIGGRNYKDKFELKAYIPKIENKQYIAHPNGFAQSQYAIDSDGRIDYPEFSVSVPGEWSIEIMVKFLENTNFKTYAPKIIEVQVPYYEIEHRLLKL